MTRAVLADMLEALVQGGHTFVTSVPDKGLASLIDAIERDTRFTHVACTREEEALGLCAGAAFAGRRGVLLAQNSGVGNAINALTSLIAFYELPLLMLLSMRGGPGERIAAQMPMGAATRDLLRACDVRVVEESDIAAFVDVIRRADGARIALQAAPDAWAGLRP